MRAFSQMKNNRSEEFLMSNYILVAETGADMPAELAEKYDIRIVPMHVSFGDETRDDGTFPVEDIYRFFENTQTLTKTSGCTPGDFEIVFDQIQKQYPLPWYLHIPARRTASRPRK